MSVTSSPGATGPVSSEAAFFTEEIAMEGAAEITVTASALDAGRTGVHDAQVQRPASDQQRKRQSDLQRIRIDVAGGEHLVGYQAGDTQVDHRTTDETRTL